MIDADLTCWLSDSIPSLMCLVSVVFVLPWRYTPGNCRYLHRKTLEALDHRPEFGFNFDPGHLIWQGIDPVQFIREFPDRIYHVHVKDAIVTLDGKRINASHLNFCDHRHWISVRTVV